MLSSNAVIKLIGCLTMPSLVISLRTSILYMVPREKLRVVINLKTDIFVRENVFYMIFEKQ